ncbi:hypothetical protein MYCTH_2313903 [Thermothelomyces thermophilus ATCC 42464]|uniref:Uncharacterized protein n=1 Tax=Thermothelomyces thermophilus (strain ATCC 42464 / BCRC 31852 / DSM 1799) TaxID=573729 RepID=G2Q614_THET4|nr:uncharacterized protein MYCTH_2313903 [Thermothelomyces thermophilus ATCC 42464]AEO54691.1 hypothetical protein MYCTH_2313903 [Thermothelomyces thermophilus ATCC 42464]
MLCGLQPTSSNHLHSFLHGFRRHRNSRQHRSDSSEPLENQSEMPRRHQHLASVAGSPARPSIDSTSSPRTDLSIDWDPLRLHPSLAPAPSAPLRDAFSESSSRPYLPHELRLARSSRAAHQPPSSPLHGRNPSSETVIYDGFNFGFDNSDSNRNHSSNNNSNNSNYHPTPALTKFTNATAPHSARRRAPSLTPSDASSECSLTFSGSSAADDSWPEEEIGPGGGLGLAPAPPPRPRPRPRPRTYDGGPEDADYYFRRGGWKRRGIVFVDSGPTLAGEDETFEI